MPDNPVFYDFLRGRELLEFVGEMHGLDRAEAGAAPPRCSNHSVWPTRGRIRRARGHRAAMSVAPVFVLGLVNGWLAIRHRGLLAPIVAHATYNAAVLIVP